MIVSHEHRFIFLKTRKTAGTSVEIALSRTCGPDDIIAPISPADETLRVAEGGRRPQNNESPPLKRRATAHLPALTARRLVGRETWDSYTKLAIERNPWDAVVSQYYWVTGAWQRRGAEPVTFAEFLAHPHVAQLAESNPRIYRIRDEIAVDRVLRYESLAAELGEVWDQLGLPGAPELPRAKSGTRTDRRHYRDYYTPQSRDLVGDLFALTIDTFDYQF